GLAGNVGSPQRRLQDSCSRSHCSAISKNELISSLSSLCACERSELCERCSSWPTLIRFFRLFPSPYLGRTAFAAADPLLCDSHRRQLTQRLSDAICGDMAAKQL